MCTHADSIVRFYTRRPKFWQIQSLTCDWRNGGSRSSLWSHRSMSTSPTSKQHRAADTWRRLANWRNVYKHETRRLKTRSVSVPLRRDFPLACKVVNILRHCTASTDGVISDESTKTVIPIRSTYRSLQWIFACFSSCSLLVDRWVAEDDVRPCGNDKNWYIQSTNQFNGQPFERRIIWIGIKNSYHRP